jgi:tRNA pseudouridine38-40 synthase
MRVKAVISYDGSQYQGFQKQKSTNITITAAIQEALSSLQIHSPIVGSGRTDAGVHATGQVIHFELPELPNDFHARFSAKKRVYRYVFKTQKPSVFEQKYVSYYQEFNPELLIKALKTFEGKHDFNFFHKTGTITHTTVREIYRTDYRERNGYHFIYFQANGFLRSQVRMMVDAAMLCARGDMSEMELQEQLDCQKKHTTKLAPPEGLYLAKIIY